MRFILRTDRVCGALLALLVATSAYAQGPTTFPNKVRIASTADDSLAAGCTGVSPTSCAGGGFFGKVILEAPTTSGIRLEVDGGVFAVREGDDSAYGPFRALSAGFGRAPSDFGVALGTGTPAVTTGNLYTPDGTALYFGSVQLATGSSISGSTNCVGKFTGAAAIGCSSITDNGSEISTALSMTLPNVFLDNSGLRMEDTNASHFLLWAVGSNLTDNRTLTFTTGDSDRTVTLSGNPTLGDWFDQSVKTGASPTFVNVTANLTGNITGTAPASTLTGTTLASNVVTSSLTTIGTLVAGAVPASLVSAGTFSGAFTYAGLVTIDGGLVTGTGNDDVLRVRGAYNSDAASQMILSWTTNMGRVVVQGADASTNAGFTILSTTSNGSSALTILTVSAAGLLTPGDNIALGSNFLSGDGGDEGISVDASGNAVTSGSHTAASFSTVGRYSTSSGTGGGMRISVSGSVYSELEVDSGSGILFVNVNQGTGEGAYQFRDDDLQLPGSMFAATSIEATTSFIIGGVSGCTGTPTASTGGIATTCSLEPGKWVLGLAPVADAFRSVWDELNFLRAEVARLGGR